MDATDRRIVELLSSNARLSYAELARQIGLSGPAVHERVGKLRERPGLFGPTGPNGPGGGRPRGNRFIGIVQAADSEIDDIVAAMSRAAGDRVVLLPGRHGVVSDPGAGADDR